MGQIAQNNGDFISSMANLGRAIELDPANATNFLWRGIHYSILGYQAESIADLEHCREIDPAYENCRRHLGVTYAIANQDELALSLFGQTLEHGFSGSQMLFVQRLMSLDNRLAAALILSSATDHDPTFPMTAVLDALQFPQRDHSRGLEKTLEWIEKSDSPPGIWQPLVAAFKAYQYMEPDTTNDRFVWLRENADFRASEYFVPYMNKTGAPVYWREKGFPPGCRPLEGEGFECD
jgi:hypothetical protein